MRNLFALTRREQAVNLTVMRHWFVMSLVSVVISCSMQYSAQQVLEQGARFVSRTPPPELAPKVTTYEYLELFGARNDAHGWRMETRYTYRTDIDDPYRGCSFVTWIPGTWTVEGSTMTVTTPASNSGSFEIYDCPGGAPARTLDRTPHFTRAQSTFTLDAKTLRFDRASGRDSDAPVFLERFD